jgi:4-hydroxy-3-polyprenylbenzoate decarboxylase
MWALCTRMDPSRDLLLVERTPVDPLDFASPLEGLGGKMGLDATCKIGAETNREWGVKLAMDVAITERVAERWWEFFPSKQGNAP